MKTSKQRKMLKAIQGNKALKHSEAARLTAMQGKVYCNYDSMKYWKDYLKGKNNKFD